jgi:hypothetical protein
MNYVEFNAICCYVSAENFNEYYIRFDLSTVYKLLKYINMARK